MTSSSTPYFLKLRTVQVNGFQKLIECMKEILMDVNWEFDETGIKVLCMDGSHVSLINMKLEKENFEYYECISTIKVGINMGIFTKLIKTAGNNDAITLCITKECPNDLIIIIENNDKGVKTKFDLKLLDIDDKNITIPNTTPDIIITMPSQDLQRLFRDFMIISDVLNVEATSQYLKLSGDGDFASRETVIRNSLSNNDNGQIITSSNNEDDMKIYGKFSLKYLNLFTKGSTNMCSVVEIMLKNQYPILIKYAVASLGHITFCLAPKIDE